MAKPAKGQKDHYFQVHYYMTKSEAWLALSAAARAVYIQLGSRYNGENNGSIALSSRDAAEECQLARNTAMRALKELVSLGFIEETRHGGVRRKTRLASEWRLTAFYCNLTKTPKSCLFMQRRAEARDNRQTYSRSQTGSNDGLNDGVPWLKRCSRVAQKRYHPGSNDVPSPPPSGSNDVPVEAVFGGSPGSNEGPHLVYHVVGRSERPPDTAPPTPDVVAKAPGGRRPKPRLKDNQGLHDGLAPQPSLRVVADAPQHDAALLLECPTDQLGLAEPGLANRNLKAPRT